MSESAVNGMQQVPFGARGRVLAIAARVERGFPFSASSVFSSVALPAERSDSAEEERREERRERGRECVGERKTQRGKEQRRERGE
jgi:hypothetical protein